MTGLILNITFKMVRLKFGDSLVIRQIAKLKSPPNKPRIQYTPHGLHFFIMHGTTTLAIIYNIITYLYTEWITKHLILQQVDVLPSNNQALCNLNINLLLFNVCNSII